MSGQQPRVKIQLSEDKGLAAIEFLAASGVGGSLTLTVQQLTSLIGALGMARQQMVEGQPIPSLNGNQIPAILNTRWWVQPEPLTEGSVLSFYHPAFGPIGFVLPRHQVAEIVRLLIGHLSIRTPSSSSLN